MVLVFTLVQYRRKKDVTVLFTLLVIFILGDSRYWPLQFVKPLRTVILLLVFFKSLTELAQGKYRFKTYFLLLIPFFILSLISAFRGYEPILSISKSVSYVLVLFIAIHHVDHLIRTYRQYFLRDLLYLMLMVYAAGLVLIPVFPNLAFFDGGNRFRGIFGNPNGIGDYCTLTFPIMLLGWRLYRKSLPSSFWLLLFGSFAMSLFLSFSRTALASVGLFLLLSNIHKRKLGFVLVFYAFLIPFLLVIFSPQNIIWVIDQFGLSEELRVETLLDGSGRFFAWQFALSQFDLHPWLGRGFGFEEYLFKEFTPAWLAITGHQGHAHNSYISFLLNNGIVGSLIMLVFFVFLLRKIKPAHYIPVIIFSVGFSAFFESWLNASLNAFTIHFLLLVRLYTQPSFLTGPRQLTS